MRACSSYIDEYVVLESNDHIKKNELSSVENKPFCSFCCTTLKIVSAETGPHTWKSRVIFTFSGESRKKNPL